ncbi:uncharacterized protein LOC144582686 [Callithrix jacchus]
MRQSLWLTPLEPPSTPFSRAHPSCPQRPSALLSEYSQHLATSRPPRCPTRAQALAAFPFLCPGPSSRSQGGGGRAHGATAPPQRAPSEGGEPTRPRQIRRPPGSPPGPPPPPPRATPATRSSGRTPGLRIRRFPLRSRRLASLPGRSGFAAPHTKRRGRFPKAPPRPRTWGRESFLPGAAPSPPRKLAGADGGEMARGAETKYLSPCAQRHKRCHHMSITNNEASPARPCSTERDSVWFGETKGKEQESLPDNPENSSGFRPGPPGQYLYKSVRITPLLSLGHTYPWNTRGHTETRPDWEKYNKYRTLSREDKTNIHDGHQDHPRDSGHQYSKMARSYH